MPCIKVRQVETVHIALLERNRQEWVPVHSDIHREPRSQLPGVLHVERPEVLAEIQRIRIGLPELSDVAHQEVGQAETGGSAADGIRASRPGLRHGPFNSPHKVAAEGEQVGAMHNADIFIGPEVGRVGERVLAEIAAASENPPARPGWLDSSADRCRR